VTHGSKTEPFRDYHWLATRIADNLIEGPPAVTQTQVTTSFTFGSTSVDWSGGDSPRYREKIRNGVDATNSYTRTWTERNVAPSSGHYLKVDRMLWGTPSGWRPNRVTEQWWRFYPTLSYPSAGTHSAKAQNAAAQSFIRRARERLSEAQALVSAGELRESIQMVLGARRALFNKLRAWQSKALKSAKHVKFEAQKKRAVANAWLEYSFGWAPLVGDVENLANAAAATVSGSMRSFNITGYGGDETTVELGGGVNMGFGDMSGLAYARLRQRTKSECWYKGAMALNIQDPGRFTSQFGLTMDNWLPSIWELVPWSFAVDYFTGLGDFISSITFPVSSLKYRVMSRKTKVYRELYDFQKVPDLVTNALIQQYQFTPGKASVARGQFDREVPSQIIRWPELRIPGYKEAYLNLGSLAILRTNNRI
jgi:hypothetical protein